MKLAQSYGQSETLEEYQVQQLQQKIATANQLPEVREAWHQLKTNPAFNETMYWQSMISAGSFILFFFFFFNFCLLGLLISLLLLFSWIERKC